MDIQKERKAFLEHWYENNLHFDGEDKFQKPAWDAWQAAKAQAVPEGFVLVSKDRIVKATNKIEILFEEDPLLALGELLSIQQDLNTMIEAQEQEND